jgi:large subunit ribosomal protein L13
VKTLVPKIETVEKHWYLIDGEYQILGRLASQIAMILRGKHKPEYSPHLDLGDHVVVINAEKIRVTGQKSDQKKYTRYTGYPGGLRTLTLKNLMQKNPEKVLYKAVKGMLPKNRLGRQMATKVRIYCGPEHPHAAQQPEELPSYLRKS